MIEHPDRELYVELNKFDRLISNLAISMSATIVNSVILGAVLWNVIARGKVIAWCSVNIVYALSRYVIIYYYRRRFNHAHLKIWKIGTFVSFALAGILFGSAGIFLMDPSRLEYAIFLYFVAGGMAVGSVGSYHNDLPIFFIYSSTVFALPTVGIYLLNLPISLPMVLLGVVFYSLVSVMAIRLSRELRDALLLRYDNNQLVRSLEVEKIHAERLNEQLVEKNRELNELSLVDPLTSLRNRRYLFDIVMPEVEAFGRKDRRNRSGNNSRTAHDRNGYGVFIVDIDHFKQVNDRYGHDSGDMVLVQFANNLKESVRSDDVVSRFGGEEFIVVLKQLDEASAADIARKLHARIRESTFTLAGDRTLSLTCSIGFVFYPFRGQDDQEPTFEGLISMADSALYHAKSHGRNASVQAVPQGQNLDYVLL
jgi:diguanylate cyclase (GGDEF)-like protein